MNHIAIKFDKASEIDIVPDIETLSLANTAAIISIGAVAINPFGEVIGQFYVNIDPESYNDHKAFTIDEETKKWWAAPERAEAKKTLETDMYFVEHALITFNNWIRDVGGTRIWGNGAEFDNAILKHGFDNFNIEWPFKYYNHRCLRTLCNALEVKIDRSSGTHHNALSDAANQGDALIKCNEILRTLKIMKLI